MARRRYVIVGCSAAGVSAAEKIRSLDKEGEITMFTEEEPPFYSRCLLPNYLSGSKSEDGLYFRPRNLENDLSLNVLTKEKVLSVNPGANRIATDKNRSLSYDRLLLSTGSSALIPPVPGLDGKNIIGLRTLHDARQILDLARDARKVLVVGAGFVGLEAAYALYRRGLEVTIVERFPQVLPQQMDEKAADIIRRDIQAEGVRLFLGTDIEEVRDTGLLAGWFLKQPAKEVIIKGGEKLRADFLVVAAGTKPNIDPVKNTAVEINRGIIVDEHMETSVENIFAAGDVAETYDAVTGTRRLTPIWPNAIVQGRVAGANMAGQKKIYSAQIAMQNAVEFRDVPAIALGITMPPENWDYDIYTMEHLEQNIYRKLVLKEGVPVGMILVGDIEQAGIMASFIRRRHPISAEMIDRFLYGKVHYGSFLAPGVEPTWGRTLTGV